MQTSSKAGILGARIFVPSCESAVVDRREGQWDHGYYNDVRHTHTYGDARCRESDHTDRTNLNQKTVRKTHLPGEQATVYGQASPYARIHTIVPQTKH